MKFAHVRVCITPRVGTPLAGYQRRPTSLGVYDDLYLQALLLEDAGGRRLLTVNADLLGFDGVFVDRIRRWLQRRDPSLAPERVLFATTHTHCGPATCRIVSSAGKPDAVYLAFLEATVKDTLVQLLGMPLEPAALSCGATTCRLGINRRLPVRELVDGVMVAGVRIRPNPEGVVDSRLTLLQVAGRSKEVLLVNYACHPTTRSGYMISGDYPGAVARSLRAGHGDRRAVMFLQGAAGDIRVPCMNTQKTAFVSGSSEHVVEYGAQVAQAVERLLRRGLVRQRADFAAGRRAFRLPYDQAGGRLSDAGAAWRATARWRLRHGGRYGVPMEWTVWRVSRDCTILALPGEVCCDLGIQSKKQVSGRFPLFVAYANGCPCYVPSDRILREGGYEARSSMAVYGHFWPLRQGLDQLIGSELAKLLSAI
ncbi:MAG: hypothetical protein ABR497_11930 [Kiritimatiellia bacterium]